VERHAAQRRVDNQINLLMLSRIASTLAEYFTYFQTLGQVEFQQCGSRPANGGERNDFATFDSKVFTPDLRARIKQRHEAPRCRINRSNVRAFETIAIKARQREIIRRCLAAMFFSNNVIGFVRKEGMRFGKQAVLATFTRTLAYQPPQCRWDTLATHACFSA